MPQFLKLGADGKTILGTLQCSEADLPLQAVPPGGSIVPVPLGTVMPAGDVEWDGAGQTFKAHLPGLKRTKADQITQGARRYICAGFTSSAKGVPLIYDTGPDEQTAFAISAIGGGMVMCKVNPGGVFAPQAHTQVQARQVVADFVAFRDAALGKLATLGNQIRNANTPAEVQAIIWSPP